MISNYFLFYKYKSLSQLNNYSLHINLGDLILSFVIIINFCWRTHIWFKGLYWSGVIFLPIIFKISLCLNQIIKKLHHFEKLTKSQCFIWSTTVIMLPHYILLYIFVNWIIRYQLWSLTNKIHCVLIIQFLNSVYWRILFC